MSIEFSIAALIPHNRDYFLRGHPIIDAIAANNHEIVFVMRYFRGSYIWNSYNYMWVSTILFEFGMRVSKSSRDRKSSRMHSDWPDTLHLWLTITADNA